MKALKVRLVPAPRIRASLCWSAAKRLSAFYPAGLDFLLRNLDTRRVVLNGCMVDCCVLNSSFDASNLGYR